MSLGPFNPWVLTPFNDGGRMVKAKDIMQKDVITVHPDTSVEELGRLFIEKNISGAPVIDENGDLYGIVTENDLISQNTQFHIPTILRIFDAIIPLVSNSTMEKEIKKMTASTVGEICSREVFTIDEERTLEDIATIMSDQGLHLIPVIKDDKLVGIIGKKDIIRGVSGGA
jgi:predicted transcriptional regulator